jgi:hypothetical protein
MAIRTVERKDTALYPAAPPARGSFVTARRGSAWCAVIRPWWKLTARRGDGRAQADTAARPAAVALDANEGLEDRAE